MREKEYEYSTWIVVIYAIQDKKDLYQRKVDCEIALGRYETAYESIKHCLRKGIFLDKHLQTIVDHLDNVMPEVMELLDAEVAKYSIRYFSLFSFVWFIAANPPAEVLLTRAYFENQLGNPEKALADYNLAPDGEEKTFFFVNYANIRRCFTCQITFDTTHWY